MKGFIGFFIFFFGLIIFGTGCFWLLETIPLSAMGADAVEVSWRLLSGPIFLFIGVFVAGIGWAIFKFLPEGR